ncbi:MAG: AAA family ATPase [Bryobacteraceae bacterium]
MNTDLEQFSETLDRVRAEIGKVIIGQDEVIRQCLIVIICGQHALVEGVPGLAKTLIVRTLSRIMNCPFARIQFTPDLMPADITGTNVFDLQRNAFMLVPGPLFTTFLLADEINRAPAKTQSALLEAMQERTVTIDRDTHSLSPDFTVFATQNPLEYEGTYPLPEAQKDRFMLKINVHWPERDEERTLARRTLGAEAPEQTLARGEVQAVLDPAGLALLRESVSKVFVREELLDYIVDVIRKTRTHDNILVGAGPRATQSLLLASRALAATERRDFVTPDDVRSIALPVLEHRIVLRPEAEIEGVQVGEVVNEILHQVPVPR